MKSSRRMADKGVPRRETAEMAESSSALQSSLSEYHDTTLISQSSSGSIPGNNVPSSGPWQHKRMGQLEIDRTCCSQIRCIPRIIRETNVNDHMVRKKWALKWSTVFWLLTNIYMGLAFWGVLVLLIGLERMEPGGPLFNVCVLYICAYIAGWSLTYIPHLHLPPLIGMLLTGLISRNVLINGEPLLVFTRTAHGETSSIDMLKLRIICLVFIMMRCGLQLNATSIRHNKRAILVIALIPCTVEMFVMAFSANAILLFPWSWSFLCGSICSTMSPVVTVHSVLLLAERGYGAGLTNIICAATAIDSTHIVTLYSMFYAIVVSGAGREAIYEGLETVKSSVVVAIILGVGLGIVCIFFPHRSAHHVFRYRVVLITLASVFASALGSFLDVSGAGFLAVILICFISSSGWRIIAEHYDASSIRKYVAFLWHFTQPLIMATIGAEIEFRNWDLNRVMLYLTCITFGVGARCTTAMIVTLGLGFDKKERAFIALATMPKGTVQAALAPMALERAYTDYGKLKKLLADTLKKIPQNDASRLETAKRQIDYYAKFDATQINISRGKDMLRMSLVSILLLAPLGAIMQMNIGPLLLKYKPQRPSTLSSRSNNMRGVSEMAMSTEQFNNTEEAPKGARK